MIVSCARLAGDYVVIHRGEEVGRIERVMIDVASGSVAHVVVACGGVFGIGERHYAIPWGGFTIDTERRRLVLAREPQDFEGTAAFVASDTM